MFVLSCVCCVSVSGFFLGSPRFEEIRRTVTVEMYKAHERSISRDELINTSAFVFEGGFKPLWVI